MCWSILRSCPCKPQTYSQAYAQPCCCKGDRQPKPLTQPRYKRVTQKFDLIWECMCCYTLQVTPWSVHPAVTPSAESETLFIYPFAKFRLANFPVTESSLGERALRQRASGKGPSPNWPHLALNWVVRGISTDECRPLPSSPQ